MANAEEYILHRTKSEIKMKRLISQEVDAQVADTIPRCDGDRGDVRESCRAGVGSPASILGSSVPIGVCFRACM